jgi:hypothetical protein
VVLALLTHKLRWLGVWVQQQLQVLCLLWWLLL